MRPDSFDPATLKSMRRLWEGSPELTAAEIGKRFGVSRNVIIGQANRRGWTARREFSGREPTTLFQRIDALHLEVDRVLIAREFFLSDTPEAAE